MSKSVLILGASSDIARAIAQRFGSEGWDVFLAGRDAESLSRDATDIELRHKVDARAFAFDAIDFESHANFWNSLPVKPDGVVCVFGYLGDQKVSEGSWSEARRTIDTNFTGAVSILNIAANHFEERKSGFIIGISSVAGDRGRMSNYIYGSAKAGFTAYLSGLRARLSRSGVNVITVKPGFVATRMMEGMPLPPLLTASPDAVAGDIYKAFVKGKPVVYTKWFWKFIMLIIIHIPERVFKNAKF